MKVCAYVSMPVQPAPKPIGGLLDKRFVYVPAHQTNVAATIARVKAELASGQRKI